ncbi:nuclear transport factor 2 family protein [Flavobacterium terrisoli]|uniref:nuclear transport factor 2 family protein n=1 Tax=Flavobacterium terrisoli TaxID=3242195 RepID=UPI0025432104|nr:nuclear transport factor 2 family protein [Flavobacterium buctense]
MDIKSFLADWLELSNNYNTEKYLEKYHEDAVLDDPSVGKTFAGHEGIRDYYTTYFIEYKTHTKLLALTISGETADMEVEFTGDFPGGQIGGTFSFTFENGKISKVVAELK